MSSAPSIVTIPTGRNAYGAVYNTVVINPQRLAEEQNQAIGACCNMKAEQVGIILCTMTFIASVVGLNTCVTNGCFDSSRPGLEVQDCDSQCPDIQKIASIAGLVICTLGFIIACGACIARK